MSCLVRRNNGRIENVLLEDGQTESQTYWEILQSMEGITGGEHQLMVDSVRRFEGTHILNTDEQQEIALGLYLNTMTKEFKTWFGENGIRNEIGEPKLVKVNGQKVFASHPNPAPAQTRSLNSPGTARKNMDGFRSVRSTKKLLASITKTIAILNERINRLDDQKNKIHNDPRLSGDEKLIKQRKVTKEIEKLKEEKETLIERNTVEFIFRQALSDLAHVDAVSKDPNIDLGELNIASTAVATWTRLSKVVNISDLSEIPDPDLREKAGRIIELAHMLDKKLYDIKAKIIENEMGKSIKNTKKTRGEDNPGDTIALKEVNWITRVARDLTNSGTNIATYLGKVIAKLNMRVNRQRNENHAAIESALNKIKTHAEFVKNGFNIFIKEQTDKLGEKTLGLRGRFSQQYYDEIRAKYRTFNKQKAALAKNGDRKAIGKLYGDLNAWIKKTTLSFNLTAFIAEDTAGNLILPEQARIDSRETLKKEGFTDEEINDFIQDQVRQYNRFKEDREKQELYLRLDIQDGKVNLEGMEEDDFVAKKIKEWEAMHSPIQYMNQIDSENPLDLKAFKGYRYTLKIPRKTIDGKNSGFYDEDFTRIANDKDLYEFYKFTRDFLKKQLSYLPEDQIEDLQSNFLPVIAKQMIGEYTNLSAKGWLDGLDSWFMKALTSVEFEDKEERDPLTGNKINKFQSKFLKGNVKVEDRSRDLVAMMKMFADMASVYQHKLSMQNEVEAVNSLIQSATKTVVKDSFGKTKVIEKAPVNVQAMAESAVQRAFYGKPPEKEGIIKSRKFYNSLELLSLGLYKSDVYKQAVDLEKDLKELDEKLENPALIDKERKKLEKDRELMMKKYEKLGGREFAWSKASDAVVKFTRIKGIAFNPFSAFRNVVVGGINNVVHASGGEDFSMTSLRKAMGIVSSSTKRYLSWGFAESEQAEKILRIMLDTGTIEGEYGEFKDGVLGRNPTLDVIKKHIPKPFALMKSSDFLFKAHMTIAQMLERKVKTSMGEFNFYEVINKNRQFNSDKYGDWVTADNGGKSFEEYYEDFLLKNSQIAKKLHGFSGTAISLEGKDKAIGRMIFLFRTWLPETFANRFEGRRYDDLLDREVEGFYRTGFMKNYFFGVFPKAIKIMMNSKDLENMDPTERANIMKFFTEWITIFALIGLYATAKALGPDDEDDPESKKHFNLVLNNIQALRRDLTYYSDPNSVAELVNSLFPAINTFTDATAAMKAMMYYIFQVENEDGELQYDGERTLLKITKALPYLNMINRIKYQTEKVF